MRDSLSDQFKIIKSGDSYVIYDAELIAEPALPLFDGDYHTNSESQQKNSTSSASISSASGIGRAKVVYFQHKDVSKTGVNEMPLVLKHYYRGGMVARIIKDRYLGIDVEKSRAFKEWRLLKKMQSFQLPVPVAVAARVERGPFYYRADLITREIENAKTLADILSAGLLDIESWKKIGVCINHFHRHDIYHADLNARNIMLLESGEVFLIDFDNSYIRHGISSWKTANLARLNRSLLKFKRKDSGFNYSKDNWALLLEGYAEN